MKKYIYRIQTKSNRDRNNATPTSYRTLHGIFDKLRLWLLYALNGRYEMFNNLHVNISSIKAH